MDRALWDCNGSLNGFHLHPHTEWFSSPPSPRLCSQPYSLRALGPSPSSVWLRLLLPMQAACCSHWWVLIIKLLMLDLNAGHELTLWVHMVKWLCISEPIYFSFLLTSLSVEKILKVIFEHSRMLIFPLSFFFSWLTLLEFFFFALVWVVCPETFVFFSTKDHLPAASGKSCRAFHWGPRNQPSF